MQIDTDLLESNLIAIDQVLPGQLYVIPIRFRPIFPGIVTPLIISQGRFSDTIEKVINSTRTIGLVLLRDDDADEIQFKDLYKYGTAAKILKKINLPDGGVNVLINSIKRFKIADPVSEKKHLIANVDYLDDEVIRKNIESKALTRAVLSQLKMLSDNNPLFTEEMKLTMVNVEEPGKIADFVTSLLNLEKKEYQQVLETINVKKRLEKVLQLLNKEMEVLSVQKKIQNQINEKIDKQQREFFLREQLKVIRSELGLDEDERSREVREMRRKAEELKLQGEVRDKIDEEIEKMAFVDPNSSEYALTRNYIETVLSLPWNKVTEDSADLERSEKILNKDHFGLDDVKARILEFLAVRKLKPDAKGSIVCLVGPPGVGKTSLGKSIARSLDKKFFRTSLGGMRDEAEIKGHRRTYVGAMPGKIIQGLRICKSKNPVFMLDEIDKMGQSYQGDPASALLEVLDPEQNVEFRDHYLDMPFDLSNVFFITTANTLDTIPRVLADRMEIIRLSGYITEEKYEIGRRYLLPKQIEKHGLKKTDIKIDKKGFLYIINGWCREAGVRNLERQIERICRKTAMLKSKKKKLPAQNLTDKQIRDYLGPENFSDDELVKISKPGIVNGLAWTQYGGATLVIESIGIDSPKAGGSLKLTGQLGDVMSESANIAFSYIQHVFSGDENTRKYMNDKLIHLHVPAGATPKDGPSAGVTMAASLYSLIANRTPKQRLAMTGELTLSGRVLPVGGIKEKIIAAKRAGIKEILLPVENDKDLKEVPDYIKKGIKFHLVREIDEVLNITFNR
ncbi:MAG TPA: endopeptidase La [Spirochaetota bacterium]|nr:endopeptidase La [Spirochaetota bacterium]HQP47730.1 endopeptidase La [Spirochaetota bacterium]